MFFMKNITIYDQTLTLLPEKAVWIDSGRILVVSDIHLGKITHFRKAGIPLPQNARMKSLEKLDELVIRYQPEVLLLLGDFFHSDYNHDWPVISEVLHSWTLPEIILAGGNHDVLSGVHYSDAGIRVRAEFHLGRLIFTHEPLELVEAGYCNIAGHIHPAVNLLGRAKQRLRLPCFHLSENRMILPAFGAFTGSSVVQIRKGDKVYVIAEDKVIEYPAE